MIVLQNVASAFLEREDQYLLMKRSPTKAIAPNFWSCVGGKVEAHELNDPLSACLREIHEETGFSQDHIFDMELRYIIIRRSKDIIRQNYIYFGKTDMIEFVDTDEGKLHWIPKSALLDREFTKSFDAMLRHYLFTPDEKKRIVVGVVENDGVGLHMNWSVVEDFEK